MNSRFSDLRYFLEMHTLFLGIKFEIDLNEKIEIYVSDKNGEWYRIKN